MGSGSSKGNQFAPQMVVPQFPQISIPPQPPYWGYPIYYQYVTSGGISEIRPNSYFNAEIASSSIDSSYPQLTAMYANGYRMLLFATLPGSYNSQGLSDWGRSTVAVKFQGMFRALFPDEQSEQLDLKITRTQMTVQMYCKTPERHGLLYSDTENRGTTTSSQQVIQTIYNIGRAGGRIISVVLTGMGVEELKAKMENYEERGYEFNYNYPPIQVSVDVFYEMPRQPSDEFYIYQIVTCPMTRRSYVSNLDWFNVMGQYLGAGWRLADIFEDQSASKMSWSSGSGEYDYDSIKQKNCMFIFEKPSSRLHDNTPMYEGTMIDHSFITRVQRHALGFGGMSTTTETNWETVINQMGQYGWQVIRIIDTFDKTTESSINSITTLRQMIFFQRRIAQTRQPMQQLGDAPVYERPPDGATHSFSPPGNPPPSYTQATGDKL